MVSKNKKKVYYDYKGRKNIYDTYMNTDLTMREIGVRFNITERTVARIKKEFDEELGVTKPTNNTKTTKTVKSINTSNQPNISDATNIKIIHYDDGSQPSKSPNTNKIIQYDTVPQSSKSTTISTDASIKKQLREMLRIIENDTNQHIADMH